VINVGVDVVTTYYRVVTCLVNEIHIHKFTNLLTYLLMSTEKHSDVE